MLLLLLLFCPISFSSFDVRLCNPLSCLFICYCCCSLIPPFFFLDKFHFYYSVFSFIILPAVLESFITRPTRRVGRFLFGHFCRHLPSERLDLNNYTTQKSLITTDQ